MTTRLFNVFVCSLLLCPNTRADILVAPGSTPIEAVFRASTLVCHCIVGSVDDDVRPTQIAQKAAKHHEVTAKLQIQDLFKSDQPNLRNVEVHYAFDEQQLIRISGSRFFLKP